MLCFHVSNTIVLSTSKTVYNYSSSSRLKDLRRYDPHKDHNLTTLLPKEDTWRSCEYHPFFSHHTGFEIVKLFFEVFFFTLGKKDTIHQVTTMLATSKDVLFPGHSHLLTTGTDDPSLAGAQAIIKVSGHQHHQRQHSQPLKRVSPKVKEGVVHLWFYLNNINYACTFVSFVLCDITTKDVNWPATDESCITLQADSMCE